MVERLHVEPHRKLHRPPKGEDPNAGSFVKPTEVNMLLADLGRMELGGQ